MSMHNLQLLIDAHNNISAEDAKSIYSVASEAGDTIALGMAAIGDLMYNAAQNEEFDPESMRSDMFNIGLLLRCLGNFQVAIGTAESNAEYAMSQDKKGASK